ncbi:MAG: InlB B-repeat-containing protein, partial [Bacteroidales bacterium]
VASGSGTGSFTAPMSGLTPGTVYYVRAYATNSSGTAYGNQVEFTTQTSVTLPVVTTSAVTSITQTSATGGGNVTSDGGATVTSRGICYGLNPNPTLSDFTVASGSGTGSFTAPMSGLTPGTVYYVSAYATNSSGTAYGNQQNFITLQETPQTYVLTLVANPVSGGYVTGGGEYEAATQVTIAATAYAGYTFINWTDHFGNYLTGNTSHVFTMPASNATLTANFGIIGYVDEPSDVFPGVYPNPASAGFYVKWEKPLEQIALLDMAGRVLLEVEPHTMEAWLSTAGIADGVYLVRIMTRERLFLSRIIVKR